MRTLRALRGLSQHELAAAAQISRETVSRLELDKQAPHGLVLRALAQALGVDVDELAGAEGLRLVRRVDEGTKETTP